MTRQYQKGIIINHSVENAATVHPGDPAPAISTRFEKYDSITAEWEQLADMLSARAGHAQYTVEGFVYALGGVDGRAILKSVEEYSIDENNWTSVQDMPVAKCFFSSAEENGFIYVVGGVIADSLGHLSLSQTLERYDVLTNTWESLADLPDGFNTAFGVAHISNGKLFVLGGYLGEMYVPSSYILTYDIMNNSWDSQELVDDERNLYRRLLPFSFVHSGYIYVLNGLLYEEDNNVQPPAISSFFMTDSYRINTEQEPYVIERADRYFADAPVPRYSGGTAEINGIVYFIGGINADGNTLRYFETVGLYSSPFDYLALDKIDRGRSSFGCSTSGDEYGDSLFISGGITSKGGTNFLNVEASAIPSTINLDGKQTGAINIRVFDENGDAPATVNIRLTTQGGPPDSSQNILFVNDQIELVNGYGMATLIPRADDGEDSLEMSNTIDRGYAISVKASVIDSNYFGESETTPPPVVSSENTTQFSQPPAPTTGSLPAGVTELAEYSTVEFAEQQAETSFIALNEMGGIISFKPTIKNVTTKDANINFYNKTPWLPIINLIISTNEGEYASMIDYIDRLSRMDTFGGSNLLDGISKALDTMEFEISGKSKLIYVLADGEENTSHDTESGVLDKIASISGNKMFPVLSSIFRIIPSHLHLDKGIRSGSPILENIANKTNASANYVVSENINNAVEELLVSKGFIGYGLFSCVMDLGEEVRIESITANFTIPPETAANWQFSIGDDNQIYSIISDKNEANDTITLFETEGRYVKLFAEFYARLTLDVYNAETINPPKLTSVDIVYHKKTVSYIYMHPEDTDGQVHNITISLDAKHGKDSTVSVGTTSAISTSWKDYGSSSQPTVDNNTKIVVPIRNAADPRERYTLEPLRSIDGFIFEAQYGKWAADSTVNIYDETGEKIDSDNYRLFPHKGFVVFNQRTVISHMIEIINKNQVSVAAEIINRVNGNATTLAGAGFFYSTTSPKTLSQYASNIIPEAINLLLMPLNPNIDSIFTANYTFYDINGREEKNSVVKWYINNTHQKELDSLIRWDNKEWQLAKSGDSIYFTIMPKAANISGKITSCVPVKLV